MKIRMKSPIGSAVNFPVAAALGEATVTTDPTVTGSPVDTDAAAATPVAVAPNSRRVTANADHANGAAAGTSPDEPVCNHANRPRPIPETAPEAVAACGVARIPGTCAAAARAADPTGPAGSTAGATRACECSTEITESAEGTVTEDPAAERDGTSITGTSGVVAADGAIPPPPTVDGTAGVSCKAGASTLPGVDSEPVRRPRSGAPVSPVTEPPRAGEAGPGPPVGVPDSADDPPGVVSAPGPRVPPPGESEPEGVAGGSAAGISTGMSTGASDTGASALGVSCAGGSTAVAGPRVPTRVFGGVADDDEDEPSELDPVDPPDPVRSASASGIDTTTEPMPSATASAPTRPMKRAQDCTAKSVVAVSVRLNSILLTSLFPVRVRRTEEFDDETGMALPLLARGPQ